MGPITSDCAPLTSLSNAALSNRQDFPTLTPGNFPSDANRQTVASFNRRKSATSLTVMISIQTPIGSGSLQIREKDKQIKTNKSNRLIP